MEQKQLGAYYVSNVFYSDMFCINFNWCILHLSFEDIRISSIVPYAVVVKYSKYRTVYVGISCSCCLCVFLRSENDFGIDAVSHEWIFCLIYCHALNWNNLQWSDLLVEWLKITEQKWRKTSDFKNGRYDLSLTQCIISRLCRKPCSSVNRWRNC